jgi:uncharacterized membrane protein YphA (DoxX/SURF4 family)
MQPIAVADSSWTLTQKIFFRFFFAYFVLYCFPFPFDAFEFTQPITKPFYDLLEWSILKTGRLFFGIESNLLPPFEKGWDVTTNYVLMFSILLLALLIALFWSFADSRRINYEKLNQWFLLYLRLYLAFFMFSYGFHKLYPLQRTPISASRLELPYGMQDPPFVLWHFLGYSKAFTMFTGIGEVIGGLLLLNRKTTTLGALILTGLLSTVVMINFSYSIPVKLFSLHLLLIAIILLWQDRKRLANIFFLNKTATLVAYTPLTNHGAWKKVLQISLFTLIGCMLYKHIAENRDMWNEGIRRPRPLTGIYNTEYFIRGTDTLPPLQTDSHRWKQVIIDRRYSSVKLSTDSIMHNNAVVDTIHRGIHFYFYKNEYNREIIDSVYMAYSIPDINHLSLVGKWKDDSITVMMNKYDLNNYPLYREKFQWIYD